MDVDGRDAREEEKGIRDCYNASLRRILVAAMGNVGPSAAAVWPSHVRGAPRGGPWRAGSIVYCQAAAGGRHRTARGERQQAGARCEGRLEAATAHAQGGEDTAGGGGGHCAVLRGVMGHERGWRFELHDEHGPGEQGGMARHVKAEGVRELHDLVLPFGAKFARTNFKVLF